MSLSPQLGCSQSTVQIGGMEIECCKICTDFARVVSPLDLVDTGRKILLSVTSGSMAPYRLMTHPQTYLFLELSD